MNKNELELLKDRVERAEAALFFVGEFLLRLQFGDDMDTSQKAWTEAYEPISVIRDTLSWSE